MTMAPRARKALDPLVAEGPILAQFAEGRGEDLVISFSSIGRRRNEMPPPEFVGTAIGKAGRHALFVSDISRSWGNAPEFSSALGEAVAQVKARHRIERITAIGVSMGAFCALAAQEIIPLHAVVAMSSQYSVLRRHVGPEGRWRFWTRRIPRPLAYPVAPLPQKGGAQVTLLHGMQDDLAHARAFAPQWGVDHYLFPELGHSTLGPYLKTVGQLAPIVDAAVAGDRRVLARAVRGAGGDFRARLLAVDKAPQTHSTP